MINWTVVLKGPGRIDFNGEFPYQVRAATPVEATAIAREIHRERHPRFKHHKVKVKEVVQWELIG